MCCCPWDPEMWLDGGEGDFLALRLPDGAGFLGCPRVPAVRSHDVSGRRDGEVETRTCLCAEKGWGRLEGPPATQTT